MKIPLGHFDVSEHDSADSIASALMSRIERVMDAEGEAMEPEVKHGTHDQSSHGSWARRALDKIADAAVRVEAADFDGYDVEKAVGIPEADREVSNRALDHQQSFDLPPMYLWDGEGNRTDNPDYYPAVEENFDTVPYGLFPKFRDKVRANQTQVSQQGTAKYLDMMDGDDPEEFAAPLLAWDPESDTYVIDDGYHRMVAMLAGDLNLFDVYVPKESPWAKAMRGE